MPPPRVAPARQRCHHGLANCMAPAQEASCCSLLCCFGDKQSKRSFSVYSLQLQCASSGTREGSSCYPKGEHGVFSVGALSIFWRAQTYPVDSSAQGYPAVPSPLHPPAASQACPARDGGKQAHDISLPFPSTSGQLGETHGTGVWFPFRCSAFQTHTKEHSLLLWFFTHHSWHHPERFSRMSWLMAAPFLSPVASVILRHGNTILNTSLPAQLYI